MNCITLNKSGWRLWRSAVLASCDSGDMMALVATWRACGVVLYWRRVTQETGWRLWRRGVCGVVFQEQTNRVFFLVKARARNRINR